MVLRSTRWRKYVSVASRCGPIEFCSHSSVGRWTWRSMAFGIDQIRATSLRQTSWRTALLPVVVEALPRLPAQEARRHHPLQERRGRVQGILELVVQDVRDGQCGVEADQVEQ